MQYAYSFITLEPWMKRDGLKIKVEILLIIVNDGWWQTLYQYRLQKPVTEVTRVQHCSESKNKFGEIVKEI